MQQPAVRSDPPLCSNLLRAATLLHAALNPGVYDKMIHCIYPKIQGTNFLQQLAAPSDSAAFSNPAARSNLLHKISALNPGVYNRIIHCIYLRI